MRNPKITYFWKRMHPIPPKQPSHACAAESIDLWQSIAQALKISNFFSISPAAISLKLSEWLSFEALED